MKLFEIDKQVPGLDRQSSFFEEWRNSLLNNFSYNEAKINCYSLNSSLFNGLCRNVMMYVCNPAKY